MRLYTFSHFMLSPMAKGIQTLHSTVELFNKYTPNVSNNDAVDGEPYEMLYDWSLNHKKCISLNAGTSPDLDNLKYFLDTSANPYPWATFYEDESLNYLMTAISLVLPEKIYEGAAFIRSKNFYFNKFEQKLTCINLESSDIDSETLIRADYLGRYTQFEQDLIYLMNTYRLAF